VFGLIVVWLFGREFSDHTAKDLLALPTTRATIVSAKFVVAGVWCMLLAVQTFCLGLVIGAALQLPRWSVAVAAAGLGRLLVAAAMTVLLATILALAASVSRGYLPAVGVMMLMVFLAQVVAILGYGHVFPLSVPAIYSGLAGDDRPHVGTTGYLLVVGTGLASVATTTAWWRNADHDR
jgi:ABC-2 type transport system permease protein